MLVSKVLLIWVGLRLLLKTGVVTLEIIAWKIVPIVCREKKRESNMMMDRLQSQENQIKLPFRVYQKQISVRYKSIRHTSKSRVHFATIHKDLKIISDKVL